MALIEMSKEERQRLESFLVTRFSELKNQRDPYDQRVKDMVADYNSIPGKKKEDWVHNHFVPYTYAIIKTIYPRLYFSIFGNLRWLEAKPESSDAVGKSVQMSTWMQRITDKIGFKGVMKDAIKRAMIYPHTVLKKTFDNKLGLPRWDCVDYFDFWSDISVNRLEDAHDCFHRIVRTRSWFENRIKRGHFFDDIAERCLKLSMNSDIASIQATVINYFMANGESVVFPKSQDSSTDNPLYKNMELLEWHGKWEIDGEMKDIVATIIDRAVLARVIDAPFEEKPFKVIAVDREPVGFYPKTYTNNLASLQYMLNDIVNKRFDNFALMMNKMFKVRRGSVIDYETLFSAPGNVIELDDLNDLTDFSFDNIISESYQQESAIRQDMQLISGMIDYASTPEILKGVGNTATGVSVLTSEAISKYREPLDSIREGIEDILADTFATVKKYSGEVMFRAVRAYDSHDLYNISDDDLRHGYSFSIQIKNFLPNKSQSLQELVSLLNIIGQTPGINIPAYIKNIFDIMDEIKNPDEIFPLMRQQTDEMIKKLRDTQNQQKFNLGESVDEITKMADAISSPNMAGRGIRTPEETLINGVSLGSPMNPTYSSNDATNLNSIQQLLEQ